MAVGKWVMTDEDSKRVDLSFSKADQINLKTLPNFDKHLYVDNRNGVLI